MRFPVKRILLLPLLVALVALSGCRATYGGAGYDATSDRATYSTAQQEVVKLWAEVVKAEAVAEKNQKSIFVMEAFPGETMTLSGVKRIEVNVPRQNSSLGMDQLPTLADIKPYEHRGWQSLDNVIDKIGLPLVMGGLAYKTASQAIKSQKVVTERVVEPVNPVFRPVEDPLLRPVAP